MKKVIKQKNDIIIKNEYILNKEEYDTIDNKEGKLKGIFVKILKDNYDDTVIKLVDLKAKYFSMLPAELQANEYLVQILKNLIGSNKDHKTSLIRDANVDWYYCNPTKKKYLDLDETERKPVQLPKKLERSRHKKFYAFYTSIIDDSPVTTSVEADKSNVADTSESYNSLDFNLIKTQKTNYADKQDRAEKIGKIGEKFIFEIEKKKVLELHIKEKPIWISEKNDSFGFDILSYRKDNEGNIKRVFIEVKTTTGSLYNQFYVSEKEFDVSKNYSENFILSRVYNAGDENEISYKEYDGNISNNEHLEEINTKSTLTFKAKSA